MSIEDKLVEIAKESEGYRIALADLWLSSQCMISSGLIAAGEKSWADEGKPLTAEIDRWKRCLERAGKLI